VEELGGFASVEERFDEVGLVHVSAPMSKVSGASVGLPAFNASRQRPRELANRFDRHAF